MNPTVDQIGLAKTASDTGRLEGGPSEQRLSVKGKFFFAGREKFYLRGVAYGPFRPETNGSDPDGAPA